MITVQERLRRASDGVRAASERSDYTAHPEVMRRRARSQRDTRLLVLAVAAIGIVALVLSALPRLGGVDRSQITPTRPGREKVGQGSATGEGSRPGRPDTGPAGAGSPASGPGDPDAASENERSVAGDRVVFASHRGAKTSEIYTMRPDGGDVRALTSDAVNDTKPRWSPDGTRIAFVSYVSGPLEPDLFVMDANGSNLVNLTRTPDIGDFDPAWSPDGSRLLFTRQDFEDSGGIGPADLYVIELGSGRTRRLTDTPDLDEWTAAWSPDGTTIVFHGCCGAGDVPHQGLYQMRADGTGVRAITTGRDFEPSWSPDGRRLVFFRFTNAGDPATGGVSTNPVEYSSLFLVDADGSDLTRLTDETTVLDFGPAWSPQATQIMFTRDPDGSDDAFATSQWAAGAGRDALSAIWVIGVDGSGMQRVTDPASRDSYADWYGARR